MKDIPSEYHKIIIDEFKDVKSLCATARTPEDKLFYFSASFGILNRVFNLHYNSILVFIHEVLQNVHQNLVKRLNGSLNPIIETTNMPTIMLEVLFLYFDQLIDAFEKKDEQEIRKVLEKFVNLSYSTSGNGYYLYKRDKLKLNK